MPPATNPNFNRSLPSATRTSSLGTTDRRSSKPFAERRRSSILVGQRSIDLYAMNLPENQGPRFVKFIIQQYKKWGYFISNHDWQAMLICIIISLVCVVKIVLFTTQKNDITGYSPYGARGRNEYKRYQEFFAANGLGIATYIFALANDGGTMIREAHLNETLRVLDLALSNITMYNRQTNKTESFNDFCISFCNINDPIPAFYNGFKIQSELAQKGEKLSARLDLRYPTSRIFGREVSLQQNFFGIEKDDNFAKFEDDDLVKEIEDGNNMPDEEPAEDEHEIESRAISDNVTTPVTNLKMVKMISIQIRSEHKSGWTDDDVKNYEMDIVNYFKNNYKSKYLKLYVLSTTYVEEEMVRGGISLLPYLVVGFFIMCVCSVVSVLLRAFYMQQQSFIKILLAFLACIVPFMSCATALGILFLCGMRFASILCVIPFLVLAIAIDSSYLMIHEWQRVVKHCREHPSRKTINIGYRVSEMLSEVGPAILISALTNILSDAIGTFTGSPEITLLCVGNLFAMFIAFIYQMTFYAGLMSLVGRYEISQEMKEMPEEMESAVLKRQVFAKHRQLTRTQSKFHDETKHVISETMQAYVNIVANKAVALLTIALYFVYLGISIWGITRIDINLTTQKLFALDSPLIELDKLRVQYQVPHFTMATVFVNRPGNLSDIKRLRHINALVEDMESLPESWGTIGTKYFLRDFLIFESSFEDVDITDTPQSEIANKLADLYKEDDLKPFVDWPEYSYWGGFLKFKNGTDLDKFFFTTAYHGKKISIWTERAALLNKWRKIVDRYSAEFDVSVFHEDGVFLDLIENMPYDTRDSVMGVLICMAVVCFIFLNSFFTVVMALSCVVSICTGILGILSWWHIDLDPITMAAMIISIGFSVDIPAHVSYHYHQAGIHEGKDSSPQQRLANCLSSVAFPAVQAGLSTILCVCSLLFVKLYMAEVFVKTMVLCVILCNLHGLVFLPAFLIIIDWISSLLKSLFKRKDQIQQPSPLNGIGIVSGRRSTKLDTVLEKSSSQETTGSSENGKAKF